MRMVDMKRTRRLVPTNRTCRTLDQDHLGILLGGDPVTTLTPSPARLRALAVVTPRAEPASHMGSVGMALRRRGALPVLVILIRITLATQALGRMRAVSMPTRHRLHSSHRTPTISVPTGRP